MDDTPTPRASKAVESIVLPSGPSPAPPPSLSPQTTGEWFREQLRRGSQLLGIAGGSLLGGFSLNRFSRFVTSGAEGFILNGSGSEETKESDKEPSKPVPEGLPPEHEWRFSSYLGHSRQPTEEVQDHDKDPKSYIIDVGPTWRSKIPIFSVRVHSPERRQPAQGVKNNEPYIVYCITSTFSSHIIDAPDDVPGMRHYVE